MVSTRNLTAGSRDLDLQMGLWGQTAIPELTLTMKDLSFGGIWVAG